MPVTIDGTNGISGVDGSASTPAVQGADTNTGMFFPAADTIAFAEGGTEVMRINSSGNVGIGTASPSGKLDISGDMYLRDGGGNAVVYTTNGLFYRHGNSSSYTDVLLVDSSYNLKFNSGYGSAATAYGCRAWVNFNGTGTVAIRASGNVSSITDNGTGDYTVNFTTAMPDTNYTISGGGRFAQFANADLPCIGFFRNTANPILTTSARIGVANLGGGAEDPPVATVTFHR